MTPAALARVVSIELSDGVPELRAAPETGGVYAIFLWCGIALGHRHFLSQELPLTKNQLAICVAQSIALAVGSRLLPEGFRSSLPRLPEPELERPEQTLTRLIALNQPLNCLTEVLSKHSQTNPKPSLSVAICTRERPRELARCLESVLACSDPPLELILVDSTPETDATATLASRFPQVRYQKELRKGLSAARNTAMAMAAGDIVAFVDDDVVVAPNWVGNLRKAFDDPKVMVVTGLVLPAELETHAQMMFESLQYFHQGYRTRYFDSNFFHALKSEGVPVWSVGAGANMAIRREVLNHGYLFDTSLGPGVFGGCGEDSAYWYDLLADGWACLYEPSVIVYHYHRRDVKSFRGQVRLYMQGHVGALLLQFFRHNHPGNLKRLFLVLPRMYVSLFQRLILTGFRLENRILFSGVVGYLCGLRFAFFHKQSPRSE